MWYNHRSRIQHKLILCNVRKFHISYFDIFLYFFLFLTFWHFFIFLNYVAMHKELPEPAKVIPPRPPREAAVERSLSVDPWRLLPEQKKYYIDEFDKLQRDPSGIYVAGPVARDFFMKSKLPNDELIIIWELADLDKDGSLTRIEFCLAFHLTVARRNGYQLPSTIPETLYVGLAGKLN